MAGYTKELLLVEQGWLTNDDPATLLTHVRDRLADGQLEAWCCACWKELDPADYAQYKSINWHGLEEELLLWPYKHLPIETPAVMARRAALLRCVAGNPWRPVLCDCCNTPWNRHTHDRCGSQPWEHPTVLDIARGIRDGGYWQDLPILADALEEAGCTSDEVLNHCRNLVRCPRCLGKGKEDCEVDAGYDNPLMTKPGWRYCYLCNDYGRGAVPGWLPGPEPAVHCNGCWVLSLILGGLS